MLTFQQSSNGFKYLQLLFSTICYKYSTMWSKTDNMHFIFNNLQNLFKSLKSNQVIVEIRQMESDMQTPPPNSTPTKVTNFFFVPKDAFQMMRFVLKRLQSLLQWCCNHHLQSLFDGGHFWGGGGGGVCMSLSTFCFETFAKENLIFFAYIRLRGF